MLAGADSLEHGMHLHPSLLERMAAQVIYDEDPTRDVAVLSRPRHVVLRGRIVF
ncbi:hypothetical protein [Pseudonocardia sp. GCM10023141]|uniref:hypothetical protein n=1 Tax=Pseudonocardia sp. GCM10023141 TaxID=3252653 RepID=UPI00360B19EA